MFQNLARLYSRRIVNVNVNILLAGILALGPTLVVVELTKRLLVGSVGVKPEDLSHPIRLVLTAVTFLTDVVCDVTIYFCLHWLANHWPRRIPVGAAVLDAAHVPFLKDATVVQLQRAILSPLLYIGFLGGGYFLSSRMSTWGAYAIGWVVGISTSRFLHTIWMLRAQRWAKRQLAAAVQAVVPSSTPGAPPASNPPPSTGPGPAPR